MQGGWTRWSLNIQPKPFCDSMIMATSSSLCNICVQMFFYDRLFLFQWDFRLEKIFEHFLHKKGVKTRNQTDFDSPDVKGP